MVRGKSTDGPVSRYLNRRVSGRITAAILRSGLGITPNQVSLISFLLAAASVVPYAFGQAWVAGILVQVGSIVDGVDGELARARGIASPKGAFLDSILDRFADIAVYAGALTYALWFEPSLPYSIARYLGWYVIALVGLLAVSADILVSYLHSKAPELLGVHPALVGRVPCFASRDVRLFVLFLASLPGLVVEGLIIVTVIGLTYVIIKFLEIITTT